MKDRGPWRLWSALLLILAGNLYSPVVKCQSYDGARGDSGDSNAAALGFSGVVQRHDGYVKGETPTIPQTSFSCSAQPYNPGLYADVETQCQVYHVCFEDRQESFLCGPGTNFNQRILACDFWYNFDCKDSPSFYNANADIGKVPTTGFNQGQSREPQKTQQPSYPNFPQSQQPPSGGSYPNRVSVPPPPPRPVQPQPPRIQPQEPIQPQPPRIQPQEPYDPQPPRVPQEPFQPQPPRIAPQPPAFPEQPRVQPQQPRIQPQPQPPRIQPQPPRFQPQPPSIYPDPPAFQPQPRPDPPHVSVQTQYPRISQGSGQASKVRPPPQQQLPPTQQQEDNGYQFDGYPSRPVVLPPPQTTHSHRPRPEFPPVVSPPRVSRPPLTPSIIRQPEIPRVSVIDTRSEYHPDANLKGNDGYRPPQQSRIPQPSTGYPSYPQRPVSRPIPQRPVSRPVPQRPIEKPNRPAYQPPQTVQQEHVDTEYVPPPLPPKETSRPSTTYVPPPPPPPPPVQQEVTNVVYPKTPQQPSRPYVPPPVAQKPVDNDYKPQPPVSPSIIREQQKPPSRPQISVRQPPPQRPKPVFPPASDHPNSNIKGGPGYNQPPPQIPRFEPTRINPPSTPLAPRPVSSGSSTTVVKSGTGKTPSASGQGGTYKPPQQERVKKPSDPPRSVYQPPIQVIDHPRAEIKGVAYEPIITQQPQRIQSPSSPVTGVKRPQNSGDYQQRPRAPIVVSRPQPPSLPSNSITSPVHSQGFDKPRPQPPSPCCGIKQPSTTQTHVQRTNQARFPTHDVIDHPNANIKGTPGYQQQIQPVGVSRPSGPPSSPSTSYEQKTVSTRPGHASGSGYPSPPLYPPRGDIGHVQEIQREYKPSRTSPPSSIKTVGKVNTGVKDPSSYQRPPVGSDHSVLINKQSKPDYEAGSTYPRGQDIYPKPEFGRPNAPYQPISTPSRHSPATKQGSSSQNSIIRSQNKPATSGSSDPASSAGSGSDVRPDYPFNQVPGHQPPHQRQVFPHRENPDHPNESLKGSNAYRPPPPAGFQAAASEVQEQQVVPEPEPASSSLHGDTGSE